MSKEVDPEWLEGLEAEMNRRKEENENAAQEKEEEEEVLDAG